MGVCHADPGNVGQAGAQEPRTLSRGFVGAVRGRRAGARAKWRMATALSLHGETVGPGSRADVANGSYFLRSTRICSTLGSLGLTATMRPDVPKSAYLGCMMGASAAGPVGPLPG